MIKEKLEEEFGITLYEQSDNWAALCPFHEEESPSFFIHQTQLICHCFGCGVAGSVETLLAKKLKIGVQEAKQRLGVSLTLRESVVRDVLPNYYPESWLAVWKAGTYNSLLDERGISHDTAKKFDIRWDKVSKRFVVPLREYKTQKLVGAAGRSLGTFYPKWYFYWGCKKSHNIFLAKPRVQKKLFIVEGILDALRLHDVGISAAALLGSKASSKQITQILQETSNVVLALDNDGAGKEGNKYLEEKLRKSCSIEYLVYPSTWVKDVCDLSLNELKVTVNSPINPLEYKLVVTN